MTRLPSKAMRPREYRPPRALASLLAPCRSRKGTAFARTRARIHSVRPFGITNTYFARQHDRPSYPTNPFQYLPCPPYNPPLCRTPTHELRQPFRPRRPGQTKRTCSPPRAANDAFSVVSLGAAKHCKPTSGGADVEGGGGSCRFSGPGKRPIKCQRCGSGRVRLFATAASHKLPPPGYLRPLSAADPEGGISRAPPIAGGRGGGGCGNNTGGGSAAGRLSSAPFAADRGPRNGALKPMSSVDHNKISGWSDNGRPGSKAHSMGGSGPGAAGGREDGVVINLRGRVDAAHIGRRASLLGPL